MIVYRGSDVIFDHEPPKWNFWTSNTVEKNHSFARTCASIQEEGNATGLHISDYNLSLNKKNFLLCLEEAVNASEQLMILDAENSGRNKRQAGVGPPDPYGFSAAKTRCPLLLVADYRFFREMGGGSTKTTINYLVRCITYIQKCGLGFNMESPITVTDQSGRSCSRSLCCDNMEGW